MVCLRLAGNDCICVTIRNIAKNTSIENQLFSVIHFVLSLGQSVFVSFIIRIPPTLFFKCGWACAAVLAADNLLQSNYQIQE